MAARAAVLAGDCTALTETYQWTLGLLVGGIGALALTVGKLYMDTVSLHRGQIEMANMIAADQKARIDELEKRRRPTK